MNSTKNPVIGEGMTEDIQRMADLSDKAMHLYSTVKRADDIIASSGNKDVIDIWASLTMEQKNVAVRLAMEKPYYILDKTIREVG